MNTPLFGAVSSVGRASRLHPPSSNKLNLHLHKQSLFENVEIDRLFLLENMNNKFHQTSKKLVSREIK